MNEGPPDADRRRRKWRERWSQAEFSRDWLSEEIDPTVAAAADSRFFPAGARLLDIGCGGGHIAAALAGRGYRVTGIDFAEPAIEQAIARHGASGNPQFSVADFCVGGSVSGPFEAALDRGCFHSLPEPAMPNYVGNLARVLVPGGAFLLLHKPGKKRAGGVDPDGTLAGRIAAIFSEAFKIVETGRADFGGETGMAPGFAFKMRRS